MDPRKFMHFLVVLTILRRTACSGIAEKILLLVNRDSRLRSDSSNAVHGNLYQFNTESPYGGDISSKTTKEDLNNFVDHNVTCVCDSARNEAPPAAVEWIRTTPHEAPAFSDRAVVGGYQYAGRHNDPNPLWVIRAWFRGELIPGKLDVRHQAAYVSSGGNEYAVRDIEVLCAHIKRIRWVVNRDGKWWEPNAVRGGRTSSGEPLFIGRAAEQGSLIPGKVLKTHPRENLAAKLTCSSVNPFESEAETFDASTSVARKKPAFSRKPSPKTNTKGKGKSTKTSAPPLSAAPKLFGSDTESESELAPPPPKKKKPRVIIDSEDEEQIIPVQAAKLKSLLSRRSSKGYLFQRNDTRRGDYYVECRLYNTPDIENLKPEEAKDRWRLACNTFKCAFNQSSASWRAVFDQLAAAKEEFRGIQPVLYPYQPY